MTQYYKRHDCRLCASRDLELVMHVADTPIGDDYRSEDRFGVRQTLYPLELAVCRECGLLQLPGVIPPQKIYGRYTYRTSLSLGLNAHYDQYAASFCERFGLAPGSLAMDIGSNDGSLLRSFAARGLRVQGIEPARELSEAASTSGVPTLAAYFGTQTARALREELGPAKILTANNVFANIDDLNDVLEGARLLLDDAGIMVIETGYMVDTVQHTVLDNIYHEHLCYFSVGPLRRWFRENGFEIIEARRVFTKGGSIRLVIQKQGGPGRSDGSAEELAALERELGFARLAPYHGFVRRAQAMRSSLRDRLDQARSAGKRVAAFGASVGMTTLAHFLGLPDFLDTAYDDNPIKHGTYFPGLNIKVVSSEELVRQKPDLVALLPWRYCDPIVKRHQAYLEQGGEFVVALPELETISSAKDLGARS